MMHHIGDPIIKLHGEAADLMAAAIGFVLVGVFIVRLWNRAFRKHDPDRYHEAED